MEKIIKERINQREEAIKIAKAFVKCASKKYKIKEAYLIGSYARGDFNKWSDIDVLLIVDEPIESNPLKRLDKIMDCLHKYPNIEVIIVSIDEYLKLHSKNNPMIKDQKKYGIKLII